MENIKAAAKSVWFKILQILIMLGILATSGILIGFYSKIIQIGFRIGWNVL